MTWHRRGEALKCISPLHSFLSFLGGKSNRYTYLKKPAYLKKALGLFGLTVPVSLCASDYTCFWMCVNNTRPPLPLIGLPWHITLPQPIVIINAIERKRERDRERETERQRERQRETERERQRERDRETETERTSLMKKQLQFCRRVFPQ